ncbi:chaplin [Streptomyces sp. MB09-01]|uniref:chaplin n=1 Tax=Streptomyces sp. MB09-01 TaxID=3028666 RepID=UPI0029A30477|nr:chaplin [Streptomyces sp. MB09-01]MDX3538012.1 chaplin [Streptomyces sp. MB09-01]
MRQVLSRQVLGKGMLTAAAASSLLSIATGAAYAHSGATAEVSHSPGVLAGNSVSVPVTFAPNVCGNSVDGGAALNPAMGNTCATTSGSHTGDGYDYARYLSPENAEAFERYLEERPGRHAVPEQRQESRNHEEARPEAPRPQGPRHAKPRHEEPRHEGGYGEEQGKEHGEEECDDHPGAAPPPPEHHAPAPHEPHPMPEPVEEQPAPLPAPEPVPAPEAPAPVVDEGPGPRPPHGSQPVEHPAPVPAPAPEVAPPADQPPAAPAGDAPVHLRPAPVPVAPAPAPASAQVRVPAQVPVPAPAHVSAPVLAETGAGQPAAAAALATALILGGAILYRRSRIA